MFNITFKTRQRLRRIGTTALIVALVLAIAWFCWIVWLERYVVYTQDGAKVDFTLSDQLTDFGQTAEPPVPAETVSIYYNEGAAAVETSTELTQLYGYYIDVTMLQDIDSVRSKISTLPAGTAIMLDVKSIHGAFYYSTSLDANMDNRVSPTDVDALIKDMNTRNLYTIARLPSLRDRDFGLNNVSAGLPLPGGYLWMDSEGCYWLDPTDAQALAWITAQVNELKELGFDEVVLSDWRFPDGERIVFNADKTASLVEAAQTLVNNCGSETFCVSFLVNTPSITLPSGRVRMYLEGVTPRNIAVNAGLATVDNLPVKLVFVSTANDTRYDEYGALRPLTSADALEAQKAEAES